MPNSATRANDAARAVTACAAVANELAETRRLVTALEAENRALRERVTAAKRLEDSLTALAETQRLEADALRRSIEARDRAIAAKDSVIAKQEEAIAELKRRKDSPWKRVGYILIGAAAASILK